MALGLSSLGEGATGIARRRLVTGGAHCVGGAVGGGSATPFRTIAPVGASLVLASVGVGALWYDCFANSAARVGRQVPSTWPAHYGYVRAFARYGAMLGAGLLTYVPYGAAFCLFTAAALAPSLSAAVAGGAIFGVSRAALTLAASLRPARCSVLLYRSSAAQTYWRAISVATTVAAVAVVLAQGRLLYT
jgi:hypothetical protein